MKNFEQPTKLDDATFAFPGSVRELMPEYSEIPKEFRDLNNRNKWLQFQRDWFYHGLSALTITPKDGIDKDVALRHLSAVQRSYEPKHEHKMATVAYLASLWFNDVEYETVK